MLVLTVGSHVSLAVSPSTLRATLHRLGLR